MHINKASLFSKLLDSFFLFWEDRLNAFLYTRYTIQHIAIKGKGDAQAKFLHKNLSIIYNNMMINNYTDRNFDYMVLMPEGFHSM